MAEESSNELAKQYQDEQLFLQLAHIYKCVSAAQESYYKPHESFIRVTIDETKTEIRSLVTDFNKLDGAVRINPEETVSDIGNSTLTQMRAILRAHPTMELHIQATCEECIRVIEELEKFQKIEEEEQEDHSRRELIIHLCPERIENDPRRQELFKAIYDLKLFDQQNWIRVRAGSDELCDELKSEVNRIGLAHEVKRANELMNPNYVRMFKAIRFNDYALRGSPEALPEAETRLTNSIRNVLVRDALPSLRSDEIDSETDFQEMYDELILFRSETEQGRLALPGYFPDDFAERYPMFVRELYSPEPDNISCECADEFAFDVQRNISQLLMLKRFVEEENIAPNYSRLQSAFRPRNTSLLYIRADQNYLDNLSKLISDSMQGTYITFTKAMKLAEPQSIYQDIINGSRFEIGPELLDQLENLEILTSGKVDASEKVRFAKGIKRLLADHDTLRLNTVDLRANIVCLMQKIEENVHREHILFEVHDVFPNGFGSMTDAAITDGSMHMHCGQGRRSEFDEFLDTCSRPPKDLTTAQATSRKIQRGIS